MKKDTQPEIVQALNAARAWLKEQFPEVKFSVRRNGGGILIRWTGNTIVKVSEHEWQHTNACSRETREVEKVKKALEKWGYDVSINCVRF